MKLLTVQVKLFRNILDSTEVTIQEDVTCLVGKNESGKTAFLHALHRLNPALPNVSFSIPDQYPAWLVKSDRLEGINLEEIRPVRAVFSLEGDDKAVFEQRFGAGVLNSDKLILERDYSGRLIFTVDTKEENAVEHIISLVELPENFSSQARDIKSFAELTQLVTDLKASGDAEAIKGATSVEGVVNTKIGNKDFNNAVNDALLERVPKFFYFDEYSSLPPQIKIRQLLNKNPDGMTNDEHTALSLLRLAATDNEYLLHPDYERRKRELESVANLITLSILKYWTQNPNIRVLIDISQKTENTPQGQQAVLDELKVRIWDDRHMLSLPLYEHSSGFRWFFCFLVAFSKYESSNTPTIILLDEPGLGLHARAQNDFMRFIDERLAPKHQVLHTTHSPFMIQPGKLERVRIVEDHGREYGVRISADVLSTDPDTMFPLQGALGYDLAQHLFISPNNLVVEGTSDYTYLRVISDYLKDQGRTFIDDRWSIIPVGGADLIPTFIALLGHHLDVTVLIDSRKEGNQRLSRLADEGYLAHKRIITVGEIIGRKIADIEDLFKPDDYLVLYNRAFRTTIDSSSLSGTDPILSRIARQQGIEKYDHGRPADVLLRFRDEILPMLSQETFKRFEKLFERINTTFKEG